MKQQSSSTERNYKLILFFVIGLAAFSSAVKEWRQFMSITQEVAALVSTLTGSIVSTANARPAPSGPGAFVDDFSWTGTVSPGQAIEIKGISGDISAEPASGTQVEVVAHKKARRGDINAVQIKVREHSGGVTICALYPREDGTTADSCEPGERTQGEGNNTRLRTNDVSVNFVVRVPRGVALVARTVNGDVNATSLSGNVVARTVNGSIKIATSGYAEATTVNGQIAATLGDTSWNGPLHFTTVNGEINVNMPASASTEVEAQTLNGSINSDFPLNTQTEKSAKHIRATIGAGGRELVLKTLNGSINLRTS